MAGNSEMEKTSNAGGSHAVYRDTNLQIIFGVTLMAVLGVSSITPAFPRIVKELNITPQAVGSLITAFTLPGVLLTAVLGMTCTLTAWTWAPWSMGLASMSRFLKAGWAWFTLAPRLV